MNILYTFLYSKKGLLTVVQEFLRNSEKSALSTFDMRQNLHYRHFDRSALPTFLTSDRSALPTFLTFDDVMEIPRKDDVMEKFPK